MSMPSLPQLEPYDLLNQQLEASVHPKDYVNPSPIRGRYNLVVIGAGTAGLVAAAGAAGLGGKVALVERALMGGDCLNVGCVPSKAVIAAARRAAAVRDAGRFGVRSSGAVDIDFGFAMERMRRVRAAIAPHDSVQRFTDLGIDVFLGEARFVDKRSIVVNNNTTLSFKKAVIATGARAAVPPIPGLDSVRYLTNETIFSLTKLPRRLGVIGAGPIGCEMAQSFARLGSEVVLVETAHGILPREERDAAEIVRAALLRDGVKILCCGKEFALSNVSNGETRLTGYSHDQQFDKVVDAVLVAVGRAPNIESLDLEKAGVAYSSKGVKVDDLLRCTNRDIYAAGDVCSRFQFTHAADFMARLVLQNALFLGRKKMSRLVIPWAVYTDPEIAHIGLYPEEAKEQGVEIDTYTQLMSGVDRAALDGESDGFVRIHTLKGKDTIVGATVVAAHAGDMIGEISLAMTHGIGLGKIAKAIHPYPTQAEAIRKVGDLYDRTRLTPVVKGLMGKWLSWSRRG